MKNEELPIRVVGNAMELENKKWIFVGEILSFGESVAELRPHKLYNTKQECIDAANADSKIFIDDFLQNIDFKMTVIDRTKERENCDEKG